MLYSSSRGGMLRVVCGHAASLSPQTRAITPDTRYRLPPRLRDGSGISLKPMSSINVNGRPNSVVTRPAAVDTAGVINTAAHMYLPVPAAPVGCMTSSATSQESFMSQPFPVCGYWPCTVDVTRNDRCAEAPSQHWPRLVQRTDPTVSHRPSRYLGLR